MNILMHPPKKNIWRFVNSTGLREITIKANTPEEAKKIFQQKYPKYKYTYGIRYNYLQQDFLKRT